MNLVDGLDRLRERLVANNARAETLRLVDTIRQTASKPGADGAQVRSLTELVRRLMRTPVSNANVGVYDDLAVLEQQLMEASAQATALRQAEEDRPMPKPKKYYKAMREKDERRRG